MTSFTSDFLESATAVAAFGGSATEVDALDDERVMAGYKASVAHQRKMESVTAWYAASIARRSARELGNAGLARTEGFPNAEALIQATSGSSWQDAAKLVKIGTMMADVDTAAAIEIARLAAEAAQAEADRIAAELNIEPEPVAVDPILFVPVSPEALWQAPISAALIAETISAEQANAVRTGLGVVTTAVSAEILLAAVVELLAGRDTSSRLFTRARQMRDRIDHAGVQRKEIDQRSLQYLTAHLRKDGMVAGRYAFAGTDGALWLETFNQATSPRLGGPRSANPEQAARDAIILEDERTPAQIAADHFIALLQVGIDADPRTILGSRRPAVRIIVEETTLTTRQDDPTAEGIGRIEGMTDAVTLATVEQALCNTGFVGLTFDQTGQCLDLGRDQRLFSARQRIALAVRDGGCLGPGCGKPPSWTEAHHINLWKRDEGKTNVEDGILLCRFHHMLFHSNGWEIKRANGQYWLIPPRNLDSLQRPILMPSKTQAIRALTDPGLAALLTMNDTPAGTPSGTTRGTGPGTPNRNPTPLPETIVPMRPKPGSSSIDRVRLVYTDTVSGDGTAPEPAIDPDDQWRNYPQTDPNELRNDEKPPGTGS
ncbi:MAG: endonuclease [Glaciihabitans sp.]|nr:endonuclease [Glaciihabitans sp.]